MSEKNNYQFVGHNPFLNYADYKDKTKFTESELIFIFSQHNPEVENIDFDSCVKWLQQLNLKVELC